MSRKREQFPEPPVDGADADMWCGACRRVTGHTYCGRQGAESSRADRLRCMVCDKRRWGSVSLIPQITGCVDPRAEVLRS